MKQALLTVLLFLATTLSVWATDITVQQEVIRNWTGPRSNVQLWLVLDKPITTNDAKNIPASSVDRGVVAVKSVCTVASVTRNGLTQYDLTIPETILYSTLDAVVGNDARYTAYFYQSNGTRISVWSGFTSFTVPAIPASTTWGALRIYNSPALNAPLRNDNVYNTDQINAINNGLAGTTSLDYVLGNTSPWNSTNFNIFVGSGGSRPGLRWNYATGKWQFSNDGSSFVDFGTGSGGLAGSGTTNKLPRFSAGTTVADSMFSQDSGGTAATIAGATTVTGVTDIQGGLPSSAYGSLPTAGRGNGSLYWDTTNKQLRYFNTTSNQWVAVSGGIYNVQDFGAVPDEYGLVQENECITATNGSPTITSNGIFPSRWVGLTNFSVQVNSVPYTVSSCASTSSCTLSSNYAGTTTNYADLYSALQASITGASTTITCAKCNFISADEGKAIVFTGVNGAAAHKTTIASVTNSTTAIVAVAPPTSGTVDVTFGTDNTTPFANATTACDAGAGGKVLVPQGRYLLNYVSLPRRTTLEGAGKKASHLLSYASSGGIIRSIWPSNASNSIYSAVTGLHIKALDTNSVQYGFHDNGGTFISVKNNSFESAHIGILFDQTEVSDVVNNEIVSYQPSYYGLSSGRLAPNTNGGWTKTGSATTGTDSGLWLINSTGLNTVNTYTKALSSTAFYKGFTLELFKGASVSAADNAGFDDAKLYRVDNGTYRYDLQFTSSQIRLNGGTARGFGASTVVQLKIYPGGATADLYIDGSRVDTEIAGLTTAGSAIVGFGDFATNDDATVYYGPLTYYSSQKAPIGVWLVNGPEITPGNSGGYTNVIQVSGNQINGNFFHFVSDGGTDQYLGTNNINGGLHTIRITGIVGFTAYKNAAEAVQWESFVAGLYSINGIGSGSTSSLKLEKNTFNNSAIGNLPPVRIWNADSVYLDQNLYTKGPSSGHCVEIDQGGVYNLFAPLESTPNAPDSLFGDTTRHLYGSYDDLGIGPYGTAFFNPQVASTITSFSGGVDRRTVYIVNNGSQNLTLVHQSATSPTPKNRFINVGGQDLVIAPNRMAMLIYDTLAQRWRTTLLQ